jgi:hypothetical protein
MQPTVDRRDNGMSSDHATALAGLSVVTLVVPGVWFAVEKTRATFKPFDYTETRYIRTSLFFAIPALLVVLVAIPAYAATVDTVWYTGLAVTFHVCEWLWLGASTVDSVLLTALPLVAAATTLTALVVEGIRSIEAAGGCPGYFLATFLFPLANVWLNDAGYYVYGYYVSKKTAPSSRSTLTRKTAQLQY